MLQEIKKASDSLAVKNSDTIDYRVLSEHWGSVLKLAEEEHGFIENQDHAMRFLDGLRRAGHTPKQISSLLKIFILSQIE